MLISIAGTLLLTIVVLAAVGAVQTRCETARMTPAQKEAYEAAEARRIARIPENVAAWADCLNRARYMSEDAAEQ